MNEARMIVALALAADDRFVWDRLRVIQTEMFAAGPVAVKFCYFGREGELDATRPYVATRWVQDADAMSDIMDRGRAGCVCGCYLKVDDILEHALREREQAPVQAVVIVGDHFYGDLDAAIAAAQRLGAAGTRLFLFQQKCSDDLSQDAFEVLSRVSGGAYFPFNPHVERVAEQLPGVLEAIAHFAIGGMPALKARGNASAHLLLEQMNAMSQLAQT